jgi:hypothetical protein
MVCGELIVTKQVGFQAIFLSFNGTAVMFYLKALVLLKPTPRKKSTTSQPSKPRYSTPPSKDNFNRISYD